MKSNRFQAFLFILILLGFTLLTITWAKQVLDDNIRCINDVDPVPSIKM